MTTDKEKDFRKLKKGQSWVSIVSFIVSYLSFTLVIIALVTVFFFYMQNAKLGEEYSEISNLAKLYEKSLQTEDDTLSGMIAESGRSFIVLNPSGKLIDQQGENSCSKRREYMGFTEDARGYLIYADKENEEFVRDGNDSWMVFGLLRMFMVEVRSNPDDIGVEETGFGFEIHGVEAPFWVSVKMESGGEFIGKCSLTVKSQDIAVIATFMIGMFVLLIVIFVGLISNIIRNITYQKRLTDFFMTDEETLGYNWMAFRIKGEQQLKKHRNAGKRYAVVHLVIVKYRNYCMCHSLEEGERLLRKVARTLEKSINPKREICGHVSSSSFALLLEVDEDGILSERIEQIMEQLQKTDPNHNFHFQAGVALIGPSIKDGRPRDRKSPKLEKHYNDACTARATIEQSDDSGIAYFNKSLVDEQKWIDEIQERQQQALDREEFVVYYQPKYTPDENRLCGAEALIRWKDKNGKLISPGRFIPIFEKNGFITEIDHYMIRHVARDQKAWLDAGMDCVPVSVNVSRAHFVEDDLAEQIRDMVDEAGTPHHLIEIELTESAFFDDKNALITTINRLKDYGFSVSMDDFGAGYSSLNSLKDMALDVLKLDAEFFRGDADDARKEIVVSEAIKLARSLNMRTVAEGVEDKEQVKFLAEQGCDMIQGFIYAEPMPGSDYEERMREKIHEVGTKETKEEAVTEE